MRPVDYNTVQANCRVVIGVIFHKGSAQFVVSVGSTEQNLEKELINFQAELSDR